MPWIVAAFLLILALKLLVNAVEALDYWSGALLLAGLATAALGFRWLSAPPRPGRSGVVATRQRQRMTGVASYAEALRSWEHHVLEMAKHGPKAVDVVSGECSVVEASEDPGHPAGMWCALLDPPAPWRGWFRLLHAANGTRGPDGVYGYVLLPVDAAFTDPISAAAHSYGVDRDSYMSLQRRS